MSPAGPWVQLCPSSAPSARGGDALALLPGTRRYGEPALPRLSRNLRASTAAPSPHRGLGDVILSPGDLQSQLHGPPCPPIVTSPPRAADAPAGDTGVPGLWLPPGLAPCRLHAGHTLPQAAVYQAGGEMRRLRTR